MFRWIFKKRPTGAPFRERVALPNVSDPVGEGQAYSPVQAIETAVQHQTAGRFSEAEAIYGKILAADSNNFDALHLLGVLRYQRGDHGGAVDLISRAIAVDASDPPAHFNLGNVYGALNRIEEAISCYRKAIALNPDYLDPHFNLGNTLQRLGRLDEALVSYRRALSLNPHFAAALNAEGVVHGEQRQWNEAIFSFQRAISIKPDFGEAHQNLGHALTKVGNLAEALPSYRRAVSLMPESALARWAYTMAQIPLVYEADSDLDVFRLAFSRELDELAAWFAASSKRMAMGFEAVGGHQPFYLAYQEENNRQLLSRYGDLCTRLMRAWQDGQGVAAPVVRKRPKVAVGIVSAHFCDHSVWSAVIKGLLLKLDRTRFDLDLFYLGVVQDQETLFAKSRASYFEQGKKELRQWVETIHSRELDVLIYPEIGMDLMTAKLASARLAPVQVVTWGHPQTSGLPTMDYFLSAEDFEPANAQGDPPAQEHYTERLVMLPHLGCSYSPLPVTAVAPNLAGMGIDLESPLLLCPGLPFKYLPQHDWILVEIARRLGKCKIVFVVGARMENLSARLRERLDQAFARAGLDFSKYVVFISWQQRSEFYGLMKRVDVFLDTIGFSGFNTAMQAIECGLPVATRDGRFMRGRLGSGILKRMGLPELVAQSDEDYIALAVRLAREPDYNRHIRGRIEANRPVLFDDTAPIKGLEDFLVNVTKR